MTLVGTATYPHPYGPHTHHTTPSHHQEDTVPTFESEQAKSRAAFLQQSPTTTPSFPNDRPTGAVPTLRPNPGMLRALLQPVIFFTLTEPLDAFEPGDTVALQFWGEGRVMVTPLPMAASKGRIPTTFPANKIHGYIAVPLPHAAPPVKASDVESLDGSELDVDPIDGLDKWIK